MYNLHCHSLLSDGVLLPSEIAVRYAHAGYKTIAITDHADYSNIDFVVKGILEFTRQWSKDSRIKVLPGVELTHLPLKQFTPLAQYARKSGIKVIIAHGQTPIEPVLEGTNRAALEAPIDILAHPGRISDEDVKLALEKGIFLELTARKGHNSTNSYVARSALAIGAKLILNNDGHTPEDILTPEDLLKVGFDAGLSRKDIDKVYQDVEDFLRAKGGL